MGLACGLREGAGEGEIDDCGEALPVKDALLLPESTGGAEAGMVPPAEAERVGAIEAVGVSTPEVLAVAKEVSVSVDPAETEGDAVAPSVEVGLSAALPVNVAVTSGLLEGAPVTLAVQLRGASAPARVQQGQERHAVLLFEPASGLKVPGLHLVQVAFEKAPVAFDHVPLGHSEGTTAPAGQKKPAGQRTRAPPSQYEPALPAQGSHVRRRTRLLALSAV